MALSIKSRRKTQSTLGLPSEWTSQQDSLRSYEAQVHKALAQNPFVSHAIDLRASAVSRLDPVVYGDDDAPVENHPLQRFFANPNPCQSWRSVVYDLQTDLAVNGNAFLLMLTSIRGVEEAYVVSPDRVTYVASGDDLDPVRYWQVNLGTKMVYVNDRDRPNDFRLIHLRLMRDTDGIMGISPLRTIEMSILQQTDSRAWNRSLMRNGGKPAIIVTAPGAMSQEQADGLLTRFRKAFSGTDNAGKVMLMTNGMSITTAGFNAADMDWASGLTVTGREIAVGLKVPSELLGDSSNKTYSNEETALRYLATHCIIPLADQLYEEFTRLVKPFYKDFVRIGYDPEQVDGLKGDESQKMVNLSNVDFLTVNEKRKAMGYAEVPDGDIVMVPMGKVPLSEASAPTSLVPDDSDLDEVY